MTLLLPRGIRNNNPGNIRLSRTQWQGEIPGEDEIFVTFDNAQDGIRAIARILLTYGRKYGLYTVNTLIGRWAPPTENDTDAYARAVAAALNVDVADTILIEHDDILEAIVTAIIYHENGIQPYSPETIKTGVASAFPPKEE